jgi:hypothetical protein
MKRSILGPVALAIVAAGFSSAASAEVDRSPPPGGVYRLKPGIYVAKKTPCGDAPNAAILRYDGAGLSGAHTRACKARVLRRRASTFIVDQSCIGAGAGKAARVTDRQTVTVQDALTFAIGAGRSATSYRYCPAYMLPKGVR